MRRLAAAPRALPLLLVALAMAAGFALRADRAEHPTSSYQSADERAYGMLALGLVVRRTYDGPEPGRMREPLHWPPGAPALFAVAHRIAPEESSRTTFDIPAAYWAQAVAGTATVGVAAALAGLLAGPWAAAAAAVAVAFYPPHVLATGEQLSEVLGALAIALAMLALAWALRGGRRRRFAAAGLALGAAVLVRADFVLLPWAVAAGAALWLGRSAGWRRGLVAGALLAFGAATAIAPWSWYASSRAGAFVPVTRGGASALFVGTYLPGGGNTVGMKRALAGEARRVFPGLRDTPAFEIPASLVLDAVARRHPQLEREQAVAREARRNLVRYGLRRPAAFARMMAGKALRMWTRYARGGARHTSPWVRGLHVVLALGAFAGLLAGAWRRRSPALAAIALAVVYSTALHALVVSQGRYNLPLMPALIAGGVAGWFLWRRGAAPAPARPTSPRAAQRVTTGPPPPVAVP